MSKVIGISLLFVVSQLGKYLPCSYSFLENSFSYTHRKYIILDILGYLKNTHKNPKFGRVRQILIREFPTKFPNRDLSHSPKFGIFVGIL